MSLVIDDILALEAGSLGALTLEEQGELAAVLISHRHFDHVRDLPLLVLNRYRMEKKTVVYGNHEIIDSLKNHVFNRELYPRFHEVPVRCPTLEFREMTAELVEPVCGYEVCAVPVNHDGHTTGFFIADSIDDNLFYSGDTGAGLADVWRRFSPKRLLIEVTLPNRFDHYARQTNHLTPSMLHDELCSFRRLHGFLPEVVAVHLDPTLENEIRPELAGVADSLEKPIIIACEDMEINTAPAMVGSVIEPAIN
jgi:cAMP phosphodiesterase